MFVRYEEILGFFFALFFFFLVVVFFYFIFAWLTFKYFSRILVRAREDKQIYLENEQCSTGI